MKTSNMLKFLGMSLLLLMFAVGCDSTPEKVEGTSTSAAADAIAAAKAANAIASEEGYEWRDTGKLIKRAEKALSAEDDAKAIKLANQARRQAENAVKQKYAELERLQDILGTAPRVARTSAGGDYQVVSGDNLWDISGKADVYANPYQWPLIYKANRSQIKDADLIYPGQQFTINNSPTAGDVSGAVQHAKMRGSWSLGSVESSDTAYLAQ